MGEVRKVLECQKNKVEHHKANHRHFFDGKKLAQPITGMLSVHSRIIAYARVSILCLMLITAMI